MTEPIHRNQVGNKFLVKMPFVFILLFAVEVSGLIMATTDRNIDRRCIWGIISTVASILMGMILGRLD